MGIEGFFNSSVDVKAEESTIALAEQNAGLSTAPDNLGLDSTLFTKGDFSDYKASSGGTVNNLASLMSATGSPYGDLRAIRMTFNINQAAAIWSNVGGGNYIDITKKQTLSMWLYFGPSKHSVSTDGFGDGMAFVLQNSALGVKDFSHKGTTLGAGETLGVWGLDNDRTVSSQQSIADTAIGKSWALEFDTHTNSTGALDGADGFDTGISGQHIAYGYPDDANTYPQKGSQPKYGLFGTYLSGGYYYTQNHSGTVPVTLNDGKWHHLTISWDPTTFQATYSFNDKNPDGSKGTNPITETTDPIKPTEFGVVPNNHLRWGFTATTGSSYEANLIAFESIPSSVEGNATATIKDETQNKDVKDGDSVNSNDQLAMNYNLTYDSGRDSWDNIVAYLKLPTGVTYTPDSNGYVGKVTYSDGSTEDISADELSGNDVKHTLGQSLSSTGKTAATVTINGVANTVTSDTKVASTRSKIDSDTLIKDIDSPSFTIKKSKPINLSLDQSNVSVSPNTDVDITGTVSYTDGTAVTNSDVSVYAKLKDNDAGTETSLDTFQLGSTDSSGKLKFSIPADKLTGTTTNLEVYVMDKDGNKSTTSTVVISKTGALSLTVNKGYDFSNVNQVTASHLITRSGNWDITVNDGRQVSQDNVWHLSADTDGLKSGDTPFNGEMVYKDNNGDEQSLMGDNLVDIANGVKTQDGEQTTSVSKAWNSGTGIFLRSNGLMTAGKYTGEINWTLSDTL